MPAAWAATPREVGSDRDETTSYSRRLTGSANRAIAVVEIAAGGAVALKPRYGAYLVAAWLAGIITNLLTYSGYYDVAPRDFGLMLAALTLARLARIYDPPLRRR